MAGTDSASWPTTAFGTEGVNSLGSATRVNYCDVSQGQILGMGCDGTVSIVTHRERWHCLRVLFKDAVKQWL